MRILGIDPGKSGGLVLLERVWPPVVLAAHRMEELLVTIKRSKKDYNRGQLLELMLELRPEMIVLERQQPMTRKRQGEPGPPKPEGVSSTFSMAFGFGCLAMAATAVSYIRGKRKQTTGLVDVMPSVWTRAMFKGVRGEGKHRAILLAMEWLPQLDLTPGKVRKPHQGLADAACLALYGAQLSGDACTWGREERAGGRFAL